MVYFCFSTMEATKEMGFALHIVSSMSLLLAFELQQNSISQDHEATSRTYCLMSVSNSIRTTYVQVQNREKEKMEAWIYKLLCIAP
ncbi:hypothetical protein D5086_006905 [Populus alba]|uniref:Uncharacterized protein n=1 Tax=Populus alba TaxID=43335 RepID=A0ACC4CMX9_POPAL